MMQRVTMALDDALLEEIDRAIVERGYQNRSEAIRDMVRAGLNQTALQARGDAACVGVLSYVYDHGARELAKRLTSSHHDHHDLTVSSLHVHLDHDHCLEVSILKGKAGEVQHFSEHVIAQRSVRHGDLSVIPLTNLSPAGGHQR